MSDTNTTPPTMSPAEYLEKRVDDQINWYNSRSGTNKRMYERIQIVVIASGVLIPLFIGYSETEGWEKLKYLAGALGALVAYLEGLKTIKKYRENWTAYRMTAEALLREKMLFLNRVGSDGNSTYDFKQFVANCEQIMSGEQANWRALFTQNDTKPGKQPGQ